MEGGLWVAPKGTHRAVLGTQRQAKGLGWALKGTRRALGRTKGQTEGPRKPKERIGGPSEAPQGCLAAPRLSPKADTSP